MPVFNNALAGAAGSGGAAGYKIERSLRFNPDDSAHLTKTFSTTGNRRTFTLSYWIKESGKGTSPSNNPHILWSGADVNTRGGIVHRGTGTDANKLYLFDQVNATTYCSVWSNSLHRDFSAWKHVVWAVDTTQSTATNRVKLYVNGVQETLNFVTTPSQNFDLQINLNQEHRIGRGFPDDYGNYMLAEMHFIDGQQVNPVDVFGEFDEDTGVWNPIEYSGTYGTNGFYLDFSNVSNLGNDSAGSNDWTANNLVGELGSRQGYKGGNSYQYGVSNSGGGGGGGAGAPGADAVSGVTAGDGGAGRTSTITGSSVTYGGGGGGGSWGTAGGAGGAGGGGAGKLGGSSTGAANPGTDGLGGGGGGAGYTSSDWQAGGAGGSGRVIIRYPYSHGALTASHSGAQTTVGSDYVYQWTTVGTGTITFPGSSSIDVQYLVLGGGGGAETGGGGGGGVLEGTLSVTGGTNHTVVVGAGGTAPPYPSAANSGGSSTFSSITALGGGRGAGGDSGAFAEDGGSGGGGGTQANNNAGGEGVPGPASGLDSLLDSPTNYERSGGNNGGNYCTLNPLTTTGGNSGTSSGILSEGNLKLTNTGSNTWCVETGTLGVSSGKWYYEYVCSGTITNFLAGWADPREINYNDAVGNTARSYGYYSTGNVRNQNSNTGFGASYTAGDVIGCAIDIDNQKIYWSKNGTWQNSADPVAGTGSVYTIQDPVANGFFYTPAVSTYDANSSVDCNFGARPFAYTPPTGFKTLCTQSFDDPLVADGSKHFDVVTYTGNGGTKTVSGLTFEGDLFWLKSRSASHDHWLFDSVRGLTEAMYSNATSAEYDYSPNGISATSDTGFTLTSSGQTFNSNNVTYVGWVWDTADSNTSISAGSLNSSVYNQSRQWGDDLQSGAGISFEFRTFNGASDHGTYSLSDLTWTTTNTEYSYLSGRLKVMNSSSSAITMTFKNAQNHITDTVSVPAGGTAYYDTGLDWDSSWASIVFTGGTLPAIIQVGGKALVNSSVTPTNFPAIASTVRANPTAGFSIVSWTGNSGIKQTIGHGLNAAPEMIIAKNRDSSVRWAVYHKAEGPGNTLVLNSNGTPTGGTGVWGNIYPTSSVFYVSNDAETNANSTGYIAYCFAPVEGYSAMGSYVGNGSANGPFIYTGFRPAFIIIKSLTGTGQWRTYDSSRKTYNVIDNSLHLSTTEDETAYANDEIDFLSNGFKPRATGSFHNGNNVTYVYYVVAENPFKTARAR